LVEAEKETNDPYFIFRTADHIQPTLFHAMGLALFSSRSIRKFLIRLERYGAFLTTTEDWVFDDKEFEPALVITPNQDKAHQISVLLYGTLIWFKKMISLMYGEHFKPAAVKIPGTESDPMMIEKLQEYFDCPIIFGAEEYSLVFNAEDLDVQLPTANASLARQNDEVILEVMERIAKANTAMRVRLKLMELLPTGEFCKATVARELCFSVRTLHNKLAEVDTSFQEILDQTRRELAEQYLRQDNLSVGDVAFLLGFSDFSNLSRAFKKWTGLSPTEYRAQNIGAGKSSDGNSKNNVIKIA